MLNINRNNYYSPWPRKTKLQRTRWLEVRAATELFSAPETIRISLCTHLRIECCCWETSYLLFILKGENSRGPWLGECETFSVLYDKPQTIHEIASGLLSFVPSSFLYCSWSITLKSTRVAWTFWQLPSPYPEAFLKGYWGKAISKNIPSKFFQGGINELNLEEKHSTLSSWPTTLRSGKHKPS